MPDGKGAVIVRPRPDLEQRRPNIEVLGNLLEAAETSVDAKYAALGAAALGQPTSAEQAVGVGRMRRYEKGLICWSPQWGAHVVYGAILARYDEIGGPGGPLGFPRSDELAGTKAGSRVSYFDNGAIYWSANTGAHEVTLRAFVRYLDLGSESGLLGLPVMNPSQQAGATWQKFEGATLFTSDLYGSFEVHGAIRDCYYSLGGPGGFLGLPLSDECPVLGAGRQEIGRESRFVGGTIYWSPSTGPFEVHGQIRDSYRALGGPAGRLGFPLSNETSTTAGGSETRWNDFAGGVIVWRPGGARAITGLRYRIGQVSSGEIDDGITWTGKDKSAELITYTTVQVNGQSRENRTRRPSGHAGTAYDINDSFDVSPVRHDTVVHIKVDVDDWDQASANDWLATYDHTFSIADWWGLLGGTNGVYVDQPATSKGGDAPSLGSVRFSFSVADTSSLDPNAPYRQQRFWSFHNFSTPVLSRDQFTTTFTDVEVATTTWDEIANPFDTAFYETVYKTIAAGGNCFGMSLESLYSLAERSLFMAPLGQWPFSADAGRVINEKHGYQLGSSAIDWIIGSVTSLDSVRPTRVFSAVQTLLGRHDPPVLCLNDLRTGTGHAVVPYRCERSGNRWNIYVADPNVPWSAQNGDPSYVEIDSATDTFRYLPQGAGGQSEFQSGAIAGFLPSTLLTAIPFSRLSTRPHTPMAEVLIGLVALVGMILVVAGDGSAQQIRIDGQDFYTSDAAGNRQIRPGAAGQMARIPLLDFAGKVPEVYARRGDLDAAELSLVAIGDGNFATHLMGRRFGLDHTTPAARSDRDQLTITGLRSGQGKVTLTTTRPKTVTLQLTELLLADRPGGRPERRIARLQLPHDGRMPISVAVDGHGALTVTGTGDRPVEARVGTATGQAFRSASFGVRAGAADEQLHITYASAERIAVERRTPAGALIEHVTPQMH